MKMSEVEPDSFFYLPEDVFYSPNQIVRMEPGKDSRCPPLNTRVYCGDSAPVNYVECRREKDGRYSFFVAGVLYTGLNPGDIIVDALIKVRNDHIRTDNFDSRLKESKIEMELKKLTTIQKNI